MREARVTEAIGLLGRGEADAAWRLLEDELAQGDAAADLLCLAGLAARESGHRHRAKMRFTQAVDQDSASPTAYLQLGDLFAGAEQPERAVFWYAAACQVAPADPAAYEALAGLYQHLTLPHAAVAMARRVLAIEPQHAGAAQLVAELSDTFPVRDVTVYVPCYNAAAFLPEVLTAVLAQSYPITEVLVIDDGSTDHSVEVAAQFPVRVITHGTNKGLAAARNTALLVAQTTYLAHVDSDVVPDPHWLERLMLQFEADRLDREADESEQAPLGGVMGRLNERYDVGLANQWRVIHMGQHHGDEVLDSVPHLYGCNSLWLRAALLEVGGHDPLYRTNGEDCDCSERVRAKGYRLAYEPAARCTHLRQDTLESVLRTVWRYHTPYYEYRFGTFATGRPADLLPKLQENLARHQEDWRLDQDRRSYHLAYPTFLGLPWRILMDLKLAASLAPAAGRRVVEETHAAVFLGVFSMLAEADVKTDLMQMIHADLAPCRPTDPELDSLCGWDQVQNVLSAGRGESRLNPLQALIARDDRTFGELLTACGRVWTAFEPLTWSMIRSSAYRLRHEAEYAATIRPRGPRIAVVNPPWAVDGRIGVRAGSRWPFTQDAQGNRIPAYVPFPFFLATAAALLKREGYEVLMVDAIAEGLYDEEFVRRLKGFRPDLIVQEIAAASHEVDLDWVLRYKEEFGDDVNAVLCGPHATALGAALLDEAPALDAVILGEYEPGVVALAAAMRDGQGLESIDGLLWRDDAGEVHHQPARRELPSLAEYPWPERETLPMYNYFDSFANAMPWPNVQLTASRGCPYQCIFCVWPQLVYEGREYRTRENADVVAELKWLIDRFGFRAAYFDDDTFNIGNARIIDLCDQIAAADLGVPICAMGRSDTSNRESFEAMRRAGMVGIKFGVETGDPEMMKRLHKSLDLGKVRRSVEWCKELGIGVHLTFSFGGPGETLESARKTIDLACELDPDTVQFSLLTPFPGTQMYHDAVAEGRLLTNDWTQFDGAQKMVVAGEFLTSEQLEAVLREAHHRWHLHYTTRQALAELGVDRATATVAAAYPGHTAHLASEAYDVVQMAVPIDVVPDLDAALSELARLVRPGGVLVVLRQGCDELPENWRDDQLTLWAVAQGYRALCQTAGFYDCLSAALQRQAVADRYDELAAFTGEPRAVVVAKSAAGIARTAEAWCAARPETAEEREAFYRTTDAYLYELATYEQLDEPDCVMVAAGHQRFLDYGHGTGAIAIRLARSGARVDAYDLSEPMRSFLRFRLQRFHAGVAPQVCVLDSPAELDRYDGIACLHVLEHVEDPPALFAELLAHLTPAGRIYVIAPFELVGDEYPEHRPEYAHLSVPGLFAEHGLRTVDQLQVGVFQMYIGQRVPAVAPVLG